MPNRFVTAQFDRGQKPVVTVVNEAKTDWGLPLGKVFVRTTLSSKNLVSVTASHELAEMLADPAIDLAAEAPDGTFYAYEVADPVEDETFQVAGIPLSNFAYPSWFEG